MVLSCSWSLSLCKQLHSSTVTVRTSLPAVYLLLFLVFQKRDKPSPHPERPDRLRAIMGALAAAGESSDSFLRPRSPPLLLRVSPAQMPLLNSHLSRRLQRPLIIFRSPCLPSLLSPTLPLCSSLPHFLSVPWPERGGGDSRGGIGPLSLFLTSPLSCGVPPPLCPAASGLFPGRCIPWGPRMVTDPELHLVRHHSTTVHDTTVRDMTVPYRTDVCYTRATSVGTQKPHLKPEPSSLGPTACVVGCKLLLWFASFYNAIHSTSSTYSTCIAYSP